MATRSFAENLNVGTWGENVIARWIIAKHNVVIVPAYEKVLDTGKGPRMLTGDGEIITPDLLAFRGDATRWVEAKCKKHFTWYGKTGRWQTGIDKRHYHDYILVARTSPWPVWLLFLHTDDTPVRRFPSAPLHCPTGLYGRDLLELATRVDHEDQYERASGYVCPMVYWNVEDLHRLATLEDVYRLVGQR